MDGQAWVESGRKKVEDIEDDGRAVGRVSSSQHDVAIPLHVALKIGLFV